MARPHARCSRARRPARPPLPARRASCRIALSPGLDALLAEPQRIYVAGRELDGDGAIDVVDEHGRLRDRLPVIAGGWSAQAAALLADATGYPPRPATVAAFADEVLDRLPYDGFALSSSEICAWLLIRAIERGAQRRD
jgi:hypothetical protein